jgi:hypothetical protein
MLLPHLLFTLECEARGSTPGEKFFYSLCILFGHLRQVSMESDETHWASRRWSRKVCPGHAELDSSHAHTGEHRPLVRDGFQIWSRFHRVRCAGAFHGTACCLRSHVGFRLPATAIPSFIMMSLLTWVACAFLLSVSRCRNF